MNEFGPRDPMDPFEREIVDSLRRRADEVPATPLGYTDVQRRIVQRRRRTATMATAAVTLPAVVGLGYLAGRREAGDSDLAFAPITTVFGAATTSVPVTTVPSGGVPFGASYRCQGELGGDGEFRYFTYCEYVEGVGVATTVDLGFVPQTTTTLPPTTTTLPMVTTSPPTTTIVGDATPVDPAVLADQVLVLDASGGVASMTEVASILGVTPRYAAVATRTVDETLVMPLGADVTVAYELLARFGVGGFDTWTPDLVATPVPESVAVVLVIGTNGPTPWTP